MEPGLHGERQGRGRVVGSSGCPERRAAAVGSAKVRDLLVIDLAVVHVVVAVDSVHADASHLDEDPSPVGDQRLLADEGVQCSVRLLAASL